jgi:L-ascorbate metabolism protein UlaG (beta-lactamase superfamily)
MNPTMRELLDVREGVGVCWVGNAGWLVRGEGRLVAFDLDLERESRVVARVLAEQSRCLFVVPANCVEKARGLGIPEARMVVARPREPFEVAAIRVEPQRALHGHTQFSVYRGANVDDCGYVITLGGRRIFEPGDSVLLQDHLEDLGEVDVLFVSPTEHNMHVVRLPAALWHLQGDRAEQLLDGGLSG